MDKQVAPCMDTISTNCPLLREFFHHLIFFDCPETFYETMDSLQGTLDTYHYRTQHTAEALTNLKVRDTIAIVAVGTDAEYATIRSAVAPLEKWQAPNLIRRPGTKPTQAQNHQVSGLLFGGWGSYHENIHIKMWYFWPQGSKVSSLLEHIMVEKVLDNSDSEDGSSGESHSDYSDGRVLKVTFLKIQIQIVSRRAKTVKTMERKGTTEGLNETLRGS